jgi:hypothetical protein
MSDTTSKIRILFDGSAAGVVAASAVAKRAIASVNDESGKLSKAADKTGSGLLTVAKGFAAVGAVGGAVQVIGGVAGALTQLAPAALLLPGALLGGAAAMGTFKIATAGMGDALKAGLSGDMAKFAEATKGMAPEMQAAAKAVTAFKPQIDALKKAVQGNFWGEFSGEITRVGKTLLPILHDGLGTIAQDMGGVAFAALQATRTPFFTGALTSILSDTAGFFRELGTAAGDVLTGIVGIGKVGAQYLPALGEGIGGVAKRFKDWVTSLQGQNQIKVWIDGAIAGFRDLFAIVGNVGSILGSVFTGLGGQLSSPLASIRALTGEVATFLKTVEAQDGLRALGETLRVVGEQVGRVVLTAFRELAPTLVAIGPVAQEVARTFGDLLVNAIQTLGPIIRGVASVLGEFPGVVSLATTAVVGFVVAMKTIKAVSAVTELLGIGAAVADVGTKADGAGGKVGGLVTRLGGLKAIGAAAALALVATALDDINTKSAGGAQNLQGVEENLNDLVGAGKQLAALDIGGIFSDISGELTTWRQNIQAGQGAFGEFLGYIKRQLAEKLPPLTFDVNTGPAKAQLDGFIAGVNQNAPTVNINGNTNGAAFALREILAEIAAGKSEVIIDGQPMPAQQALKFVTDLINNSNPEVLINGNPTPAGDALAGFLSKAQGSTATATLNANGAPAYETVGGWTRAAEGTVGVASLDANKAPAEGKTNEWVGGVSRTRGTATLDANPAAANAQVSGWTGRANATTGTSKLNANPAQANGVTTGWQGDANRAVGTAKLNANDSGARGTLAGLLRDWGSRILTWSVRIVGGALGLADGGPVMAGMSGFASGGAIRGRGTGTSDSIPTMLSNGEHVLTAREVAAAGGHAAIFALRKQLMRGRVPRMNAVGGRAATGGAVSAATALPTPQVSVAVHIGNKEITDIVRTEINTSSRATRRTVGMGAGTSF